MKPSLAYCDEIGVSLFQKCGTRTRTKLVDIVKVAVSVANYQAAIWRRCIEQDPKVPSPVGRGWKIEKEEGVEQLVVIHFGWMNSQYLRQSWICWLAIAHGSAHYLNVCVCQTD